MNAFEFIKPLIVRNDSKIVLYVCDGIGGLPRNGKTELETANTPEMDKLAKRSELGQLIPVLPGITPGSGPGHFALFGYDPVVYKIGRGVLSALGIDFDLRHGDLAARLNFATMGKNGVILDRRAGRIPTEKNQHLLERLRDIKLEGVQLFLETVKEYRAVLVLRGEGLSDDLQDTDPQRTGIHPHDLTPGPGASDAAKHTAKLLNQFIDEVKERLKDEKKANMILMRGIAIHRPFPSFKEVYGLDAAAISVYPMYRGLAKLVGMDVYAVDGGLHDELDQLEKIWKDYNFFFIHFKYTDSTGEDGDFDAKVQRIEEADTAIPRLLALKPDVLAVTGDHSTPSAIKAHSWHPIPCLIHGRFVRTKPVDGFGETECAAGTLGTIQAKHLMLLLLAHAGKLDKYGA